MYPSGNSFFVGNGQPRRYVLRAVREATSSSEQLHLSQEPQRILGPDDDVFGVCWGHQFSLFGDVRVPGQSSDDRWQMARTLRSLGFMDKEAYPTLSAFMSSLPFLYRRTDIMLFVMDARVFGFLVKGRIKEGSFDFFRSTRSYTIG